MTPCVTVTPEADIYTRLEELKSGGGQCQVDRRRKGKVYLNYTLYGTGPKKILFVMGLYGTGFHWAFQAEYFGSLPDYQVCVFDNRGIGLSSISPGNYTTKLLALDALELLDYLDWKSNVNLVGVSMGGMISQIMALRQPERFATVVFTSTYNSSALALPTQGDLKIFFNIMARSRQGLVRPLIKVCFPKPWLEEEMAPGLTNFQFLEEASTKLAVLSSNSGTAGENAQLVSALLHNVAPHKLRSIPKSGPRCLVAHGTKDRIIRPALGSLLSSFLGCPLVLFKNSGHMLMIERRTDFNALLRAHFEDKPLDALIEDNTPRSPYITGTKGSPPLIITRGGNSQSSEKTRSSPSRSQSDPSWIQNLLPSPTIPFRRSKSSPGLTASSPELSSPELPPVPPEAFSPPTSPILKRLFSKGPWSSEPISRQATTH